MYIPLIILLSFSWNLFISIKQLLTSQGEEVKLCDTSVEKHEKVETECHR